MFFTLMVRMDIVSLNQLDMTQEELRLLEESLRSIPLEDLNKISIKRLAAIERATWCMPSTKGRLTKTLPISVIPQEDLHNIDITNSELASMYNVHKRYIIQYRKENGINAPRYKSIEVIPLEELNNPYNSVPSLSKKYNVPPQKIYDHRRELGISGKSVSKTKLLTTPISTIPVDELHNQLIDTKSLSRKYGVHLKDIRKYRINHGIKYVQWLPVEERVPLHELLDSYISGPTLARKYNVSNVTITQWRKERGIRYTGKKK